MKRITGRCGDTLAGSENGSAFVPLSLPPRDPPISMDERISRQLRVATGALDQLDLAGKLMASLGGGFIYYAFVRKEATASSQIEGTQATLIDLLNFEAEPDATPDAEVEEVCNYLVALNYARDEQAKEGAPSMRLLHEAHRRLMHGVRGADKQPGEVRRSQNWIGGGRLGNAAYVPPPAQLLPELLSDLEKYLHKDNDLPALVRVGLAHVQFESLHPYLDGNGRIGRLLIALLLEHWGLLKAPLLYISLFFKRYRWEYFRRLSAVRSEGDWEGWINFFLDGVATIANEAVASALELSAIVTADRSRVLAQDTSSVSSARLFELLPKNPIISVATAMQLIETSKPTATRAIEILLAAGVLVETTGGKRNRSFIYRAYVEQLQIGTEPDRT